MSFGSFVFRQLIVKLCEKMATRDDYLFPNLKKECRGKDFTMMKSEGGNKCAFWRQGRKLFFYRDWKVSSQISQVYRCYGRLYWKIKFCLNFCAIPFIIISRIHWTPLVVWIFSAGGGHLQIFKTHITFTETRVQY